MRGRDLALFDPSVTFCNHAVFEQFVFVSLIRQPPPAVDDGGGIDVLFSKDFALGFVPAFGSVTYAGLIPATAGAAGNQK